MPILPVILIAALGYMFTSKYESAQIRASEITNDLAVIQAFQETYFQNGNRGLSLTYLTLLNDKDKQFEMRTFVAWNIFKVHGGQVCTLTHTFPRGCELSPERAYFEFQTPRPAEIISRVKVQTGPLGYC